MSEWNQMGEHYIREEKKRWHFLKHPDGIADKTYIMTEPEKKNQICAVFDASYQFQRMINIDTEESLGSDR